MTRCVGILSVAILLVYPSDAARAQSTPPPAFDVASIRPHVGRPDTEMILKISGTLVVMEGYNLEMLVMEAYHAKDYEVSMPHGLSEKDTDNFYDLALRAPGENPPALQEVRRMLQTLLADRLKLAIHRDTKVMPVYALVVEKGGPKLKESVPGEECSIAPMGPRSPKPRIYVYQSKGCPVGHFVDFLLTMMGTGRPVVDKTGLTRNYDISFEATPNFMMTARSDPDDISVFTAIKTLGLKLQPQHAPIEVIVVDHIEKPSEN